MKTFKEILLELNACESGREWVGDKTLNEFWETCNRGDWMLWLYRRANNYDFRTITYAKALCAETVIHLMKDERSRNAVEVAKRFGKNEATESELFAAAAAYDDDADAADASAAAAADAGAYDGYAAADAARKTNQQITADICRNNLPMPIFK